MSYTPENEQLDEIEEQLLDNLKEYKERAENRILNAGDWNQAHRLKLRSIVNKIFELQIAIHEL